MWYHGSLDVDVDDYESLDAIAEYVEAIQDRGDGMLECVEILQDGVPHLLGDELDTAINEVIAKTYRKWAAEDAERKKNPYMYSVEITSPKDVNDKSKYSHYYKDLDAAKKGLTELEEFFGPDRLVIREIKR